jgi:hypothetical protein
MQSDAIDLLHDAECVSKCLHGRQAPSPGHAIDGARNGTTWPPSGGARGIGANAAAQNVLKDALLAILKRWLRGQSR